LRVTWKRVATLSAIPAWAAARAASRAELPPVGSPAAGSRGGPILFHQGESNSGQAEWVMQGALTP